MVREHVDGNPSSAPYLARVVETSIRLATIRAAGRWGRGAKVAADDMVWGTCIAWLAANGLANRVQDYMPQNERGGWAEKIAGLIHRRGVMKPRDIQQHIRSRLHSRELKDILSQLVEAGEIEWTGQGYQAVQ